MIGHVVMWKFEEQYDGRSKAEHLAQLAQDFKALAPQIEGLVSMEFGVGTGEGAAAYDAVLVTKFVSREALAAYDVHPEHQKIRAHIRAFAVDRRVVDYEAEA